MNGQEASGTGPLGRGAVPIGEALSDLLLSDAARAREPGIQVSAAVAAALRAAVDWLTDNGASLRPPRLSNDDGVLELSFDSVTPMALVPAAEVLESADANLGPVGDRSGTWVVRAPLVAEREMFLLVEQGRLRLAVPWHAVVRVRLVATEAIDGFVQRQQLAVIPPFDVPVGPLAERPTILMALGLKRAVLVADRLVWRMAAERVVDPGPAPALGLRRAVRIEGDEPYWVVEPRWALRGAAPIPLPEPAEVAPAPSEPDLTPAPAPPPPIPLPSPVRAHAPAVDEVAPAPEPEPVAEPPAPVVLGAEFVEPYTETLESPRETPMHEPRTAVEPVTGGAAAIETSPASPLAPPVPAAPTAAAPETPSTPGPALRVALVAEDSITARIFLTRLLEQQGFRVQGVTTAAALRAALRDGSFSIVFADIELPDGRGTELLRPLSVEAFGAGTPLVALVRDAADSEAARAAGVVHHLRKPYERESLDRLLLRLEIGKRTP